jgi:DNA-binding MarR family transcriptional regulator
VGRTDQNPTRRLAKGNAAHIGRDFLPLSGFFYDRVFTELARHGFDDVRMGHQTVFINIDDEGTTLTELAARANLSKQAMHELVNDLEARGYVERVASPTDGRSKLIRTTDRGERHIEAAWQIIAQIEKEWTEVLGPAAMERLRKMLKKLHEHHDGAASKVEKGA